jgi:hypothetical protein
MEICIVIVGESPEENYYNNRGKGLSFYQGKNLQINMWDIQQFKLLKLQKKFKRETFSYL